MRMRRKNARWKRIKEERRGEGVEDIGAQHSGISSEGNANEDFGEGV
jgi:hypothetical protein